MNNDIQVLISSIVAGARLYFALAEYIRRHRGSRGARRLNQYTIQHIHSLVKCDCPSKILGIRGHAQLPHKFISNMSLRL